MQYSIFSSIEEVPSEHWISLEEQAPAPLKFAFLDALEKSNLTNIQFFYVLFYDGSEPIAAAPLFTIRTDMALFSGATLKRLFYQVRRLFPSALTLTTLECGSPVTINSPSFIVKPGVNSGEFLRSLSCAMREIARKHWLLLSVVRDFEEEADTEAYRTDLKQLGFSWLPSLPNTYLDINWQSLDEYHQAMRSHYRNKLFKQLDRFADSDIRYEIDYNFSDRADTLCVQWLNVHERATELKREVLTPEFYAELNQNLRGEVFTVLFFKGSELIGHVLLLKDRDMLRWLYMGREGPIDNHLYYSMVHKIIEVAINLEVKRLELGLTTYLVKQNFGAQVVPVNIALKLNLPGFNRFLGFFYSLLHQDQDYPPRRVFKS